MNLRDKSRFSPRTRKRSSTHPLLLPIKMPQVNELLIGKGAGEGGRS